MSNGDRLIPEGKEIDDDLNFVPFRKTVPDPDDPLDQPSPVPAARPLFKIIVTMIVTVVVVAVACSH
jgi:hypothetical protein